MLSIWWMMIPVLAVFAILYGVMRYRTNIGRRALKEEEKLLAGQFELLQKEQKEMDHFKKQIVEEIHLWKMSRQEERERIALFQKELLDDMEPGEDQDRCFWQDTLFNLTFLHELDACRRQGIEVTLDGFPQSGMPVPKAGHAELTGLIINLFDNAREACQLIPEIEDRWISIRVRKDRDRLFLSMKNSCSERSIQRSGTNTWKKRSEEHGIGLDIINDLVSGMNGWFENERRENVYHAELMLPLGRDVSSE